MMYEQPKPIASPPLLLPPLGVDSNFVDPETRAQMQIQATSAAMAISMLFYANRVYVKHWLLRQWTWDDVTLLLAVLLGIFTFAVQTYGVEKAYMARHLWDISVEQARDSNVLLSSYIPFILPPWTLLLVKATFFILYLSIFGSLRWVRLICWFGLTCISIVHVAIGSYSVAIAVIASTKPYDMHSWEPRAIQIGVAASIPGLVVDTTLLLIPIIAIAPLQLSRAKKIGALLIFLTGVLAVVTEALGIYFRDVQMHSPDKHWAGVPVNIAGQCEIHVGIVCASMPAMAKGFRNDKSLYKVLARRILGFRSSVESKDNVELEKPFKKREARSVTNVMKSTDRKYASYFALVGTESHEEREVLPTVPSAHFPRQSLYVWTADGRQIDINDHRSPYMALDEEAIYRRK